MYLSAGLTCSVHFVILAVGRLAAFSGLPWMPLFMSFKCLSVCYALDILAWDVFFGLRKLFAAPVFRGDRFRAWIRTVMVLSGALSLARLSGVMVVDMRLRMIGVAGYGGLFPIVALLVEVLFYQSSHLPSARR